MFVSDILSAIIMHLLHRAYLFKGALHCVTEHNYVFQEI